MHKSPSNFTAWLRGYMGRHAKASKGLGLKALARRINRAMYYVHLRCEPFDDTKYPPLLSESSYPLCDVSKMGFTKRVEHALKTQEFRRRSRWCKPFTAISREDQDAEWQHYKPWPNESTR